MQPRQRVFLGAADGKLLAQSGLLSGMRIKAIKAPNSTVIFSRND
jgi:hypothetical protein